MKTVAKMFFEEEHATRIHMPVRELLYLKPYV